MPEYLDVYFLSENRNFENVNHFLNKYVKERDEIQTNYVIEDVVFDKADEVMEYLFKQVNIPYGVYWKSTNPINRIKFAMAFYTNDDHVILGVSLVGRYPFPKYVSDIIIDIRAFLNARHYCIAIEQPPPLNSKEFLDFCAKRKELTKEVIEMGNK